MLEAPVAPAQRVDFKGITEKVTQGHSPEWEALPNILFSLWGSVTIEGHAYMIYAKI